MSIIALPAGLRVGALSFGQARYDMLESSDVTGNQASRVMGPPRWRASLASPAAMLYDDACAWEALVLQLRGGVNHLSLHDLVRPAPRGTMRGSMTLNAAVNIGDTTVSVTAGSGQAGRTLLLGDWLQVGSGLGTSQLVKVVAAATANGSGVISLTIEPPLRIFASGSTTVTWDKPIAYYKAAGAPQWSYGAGRTQAGFALDLLESWS